jgi:hypothetical protein
MRFRGDDDLSVRGAFGDVGRQLLSQRLVDSRDSRHLRIGHPDADPDMVGEPRDKHDSDADR